MIPTLQVAMDCQLPGSGGARTLARGRWDRRARSAPHVRVRDKGTILKHNARQYRNAPDHLLVLEALDGTGHVSQRRVAARVGMATSRVNRIIRELLERGLVRVVDEAVRPYAYALTPDGKSYLRELSYDHFAAVVGRFRQIQRRIGRRLAELRAQGMERVLCYGAGEVMEVVGPLAESHGLRVVGVVDDDPAKQGRWGRFEVTPPEAIDGVEVDVVVITTFRHAGEIRARLGGASGAMKVVEL